MGFLAFAKGGVSLRKAPSERIASAYTNSENAIDCEYMLRHLPGLPALGRVLLACSLCLLAFAFAMEAKTAWYGPALGSAREISAAKALPAADAAVVAERAHLASPVPPESILIWLAAFASILMAAAGASGTRSLASYPVPVSSRPHFSPLHFFRPPPARL